jgi:hypothetical protein
MRFDRDEAIGPTYWGLMTTYTSAWMPAELVPAFTKRATQTRKVTLRVEDFDGETRTDAFSLVGLTKALSRLSCYTPM